VLLIPKRHGRTDRQTDGRLTVALPRSALASRGIKGNSKGRRQDTLNTLPETAEIGRTNISKNCADGPMMSLMYQRTANNARKAESCSVHLRPAYRL